MNLVYITGIFKKVVYCNEFKKCDSYILLEQVENKEVQKVKVYFKKYDLLYVLKKCAFPDVMFVIGKYVNRRIEIIKLEIMNSDLIKNVEYLSSLDLLERVMNEYAIE